MTPAGLEGAPSSGEVQALLALFNAGQYTELEPRTRALVERFPQHPFGWQLVGGVAHALGRHDEALFALQRAASLSPKDAEPHRNLGAALEGLARYDEAEMAYRRALRIEPSYAEAHFNLGNVLRATGQVERSIAAYRTALRFDPHLLQAHNNLSLGLEECGRLADAEACLHRALTIAPGYADAWLNLGNVLKKLARNTDAEVAFRRAIDASPDCIDALCNLGVILYESGRLSEAEAFYQRALLLQPNHPRTLNNLGVTLRGMGRLEESANAYRAAIRADESYATPLGNLGVVLHMLGQFDEAEAVCNQALSIDPNLAEAHSNLLLMMQYDERRSHAEAFALAREFAARHDTPPTCWPRHVNSRDPERRLRIGYVSPDFRRHPVAHFVEPVLRHHDHDKFEVFAYFNAPLADATSLYLKSFCDHWREIAGLPDDAVAQRILDDGIDVLIDLAGHTANNRLEAFARKPAPVQASWLGYGATTGLASMDYRITDIQADPPGMTELWYTEKLCRLPEINQCYAPPERSPEVGPLPALRNGFVTFGSFNNFVKVTPRVRALWARVLLAVPGSRLMLKTMALKEATLREQIIIEFSEMGIASERLVLIQADASHFDHMNRYNQVDIALDSFPYNGITTSFDALWMGVPVISLIGDSFVSRMGISILHNLGLHDWMAESSEAYVDCALRQCADLQQLSELRLHLRKTMTASSLVEAERFTRQFELALREMWRKHCHSTN